MRKITLERLIYKNYLKTSLTSIIFIELVLVLIYFKISENMTNKSMEFILENIKGNTYQLVDEKLKNIENKIENIKILTKILQKENEKDFELSLKDDYQSQIIFKQASNGMHYKSNNNNGSSVIISKDTDLNVDLKKEIINNEKFDSIFKTLVGNNKDIIAVYFNSRKNYSRYYPFIENSYDVFPSLINVKNYNFYYLADEYNNPAKDVVLTDVYLDPAKQGWILSAIVPIYHNNILEGVSGIDITLDSFIDSFLDIKLPYNGKSFILNNNGKIIAMTKEFESIFNIKNNDEDIYKNSKKINETIYKLNNFNIFESFEQSVSSNFKNIIEGKEYLNKITINNKNYFIFTHKMEKTPWTTVSLIAEDNVLIEVRKLEDYYNKLGYIIIASIFVFYIVFFLFLKKQARNFVKLINEPLLKIITMSKNFGEKKEEKDLEPCGIFEIDKLSANFYKMLDELDERTNKFINEETKRIYQQRLANTDSLTGAYNRRYLNEFSEEYLKIVKRENLPFSLLLLDIDDFKIINDTYGHDVGDTILKQLVEISKDSIRNSDLIVRYGGDEFIILLPNTNKDAAKVVALKVIEKIEEYNKNKEIKFFISIGVSNYINEDISIDNLIVRADISLYEAKKMGKNRIV